MSIHVRKEYVLATDRESAWKSLTDFTHEEANWGNIRDVKVLKNDGNVLERTATVGPKLFGSKTRQVITMNPMNNIDLKFDGKSLSGNRTIRISEDSPGKIRIDIEWNIEIREVPDFVQGIVSDQLEKATDHAISLVETGKQ